MGLAGAVVGVLAQDHDLGAAQRGQVQGGEDVLLTRVHRVLVPLGGDEGLQLDPVGLGQLPPQDRVPVGDHQPAITPPG